MMSRVEEVKQKHKAVISYMERRHLDAIVIARRPNFSWLTAGGQSQIYMASEMGVAALLVTPERILCVTNTIEAPRMADEEFAGLDIEVRSYPWYDANEATKLWSEVIGKGRAACDVRVEGLAPEVELLSGDFNNLRWSLTEGEIERYRALGKDAAECLEGASRTARPGMTEHELAAKVAGLAQERAIRSPVVLIAADDRIKKYRHPIPTLTKFDKYGMAVLCGERGGLIISHTRLFSFNPLSDDLRRRHEATCQVDANIIAATRPGKTLGELFTVIQEGYAAAGFPDEYKLHHQGGSTGYTGRDVRGTPGNSTPVMLNQAFAWNPTITGTKSEDTILVGAERNEILSLTGKWPTTKYAAGGQNWPRCDILVL